MRGKLKQQGYIPEEVLKARSPFFPVVPIIGILLIIGSLLFMVFQPDLQSAFVLAIVSLGSPVVLFSILKRKGKIRKPEYSVDEQTFEQRFPSLKK
jgi:amino acid permease